MLPLLKDLPAALTDHLDRSPDKQLLRGRVGYIESWVLDDEEESTYDEDGRILQRIPKVVFVCFDEEHSFLCIDKHWLDITIDRDGFLEFLQALCSRLRV